MKIVANSIRLGNILVHENALWVVAKHPEHTKPGKGGAYVQVEMKNLKTGTKLNTRFSSSENVERASLEQKSFQYLYPEGDKLVFMDNESFEQLPLNPDILNDRLPLLRPNMDVKIEFYEETPLNVTLPSNIVAEVIETEPVIRGATATATYKPAIIENGVRVMVPPYIESGQKIIIKTEDISFVERAK
ncbi:MAG: elongation factor P [Alphaproteobacteria bacterium]|nr:elongation factor P [Alphaproteobacteria bacterium]